MKEFDIVILTQPIDESEIPIGTHGTIVHTFGGDDPNHYLVEWFDENNKTIDVTFAEKDQLKLR